MDKSKTKSHKPENCFSCQIFSRIYPAIQTKFTRIKKEKPTITTRIIKIQLFSLSFPIMTDLNQLISSVQKIINFSNYNKAHKLMSVQLDCETDSGPAFAINKIPHLGYLDHFVLSGAS